MYGDVPGPTLSSSRCLLLVDIERRSWSSVVADGARYLLAPDGAIERAFGFGNGNAGVVNWVFRFDSGLGSASPAGITKLLIFIFCNAGQASMACTSIPSKPVLEPG